MKTIRRFRQGKLYIQSMPLTDGRFTAWSSEQPSIDAFYAPGDVYCQTAPTEKECIDNLLLEIEEVRLKELPKPEEVKEKKISLNKVYLVLMLLQVLLIALKLLDVITWPGWLILLPAMAWMVFILMETIISSFN